MLERPRQDVFPSEYAMKWGAEPAANNRSMQAACQLMTPLILGNLGSDIRILERCKSGCQRRKVHKSSRGVSELATRAYFLRSCKRVNGSFSLSDPTKGLSLGCGLEPVNLAGDDYLRISRQAIPYDKSLIACRKSGYDRERTGIR